MLPVPLFLAGGVMLSCSTGSSVDWPVSWSCETERFLGELKSLPGHQCLQDRTGLRCPWKKGPIIQMKPKEATSCYTQMLRQILYSSPTNPSRTARSEKALGQLLTSLVSNLEALEGVTEQGLSCPPRPLAHIW